LRVEAQAALALTLRRDSQVRNELAVCH
jgi:hypothetical protein